MLDPIQRFKKDSSQGRVWRVEGFIRTMRSWQLADTHWYTLEDGMEQLKRRNQFGKGYRLKNDDSDEIVLGAVL